MPTEKGSLVGYELMRAALQIAKNARQERQLPIFEIRTGRYDLSEKRNPIGKMLARAINQVKPESITTETFQWNGETGLYYSLSTELFEELLDEFGAKMSPFII